MTTHLSSLQIPSPAVPPWSSQPQLHQLLHGTGNNNLFDFFVFFVFWSTQQQLRQLQHGTENICLFKGINFIVFSQNVSMVILGLNLMVVNFNVKDYDNYYQMIVSAFDYLASLVTDDDWNSWTLKENQMWSWFCDDKDRFWWNVSRICQPNVGQMYDKDNMMFVSPCLSKV